MIIVNMLILADCRGADNKQLADLSSQHRDIFNKGWPVTFLMPSMGANVQFTPTSISTILFWQQSAFLTISTSTLLPWWGI